MANYDRMFAELARATVRQSDYSRGLTPNEWAEVCKISRHVIAKRLRIGVKQGKVIQDRAWRAFAGNGRTFDVYRPVKGYKIPPEFRNGKSI